LIAMVGLEIQRIANLSTTSQHTSDLIKSLVSRDPEGQRIHFLATAHSSLEDVDEGLGKRDLKRFSERFRDIYHLLMEVLGKTDTQNYTIYITKDDGGYGYAGNRMIVPGLEDVDDSEWSEAERASLVQRATTLETKFIDSERHADHLTCTRLGSIMAVAIYEVQDVYDVELTSEQIQVLASSDMFKISRRRLQTNRGTDTKTL
jgi:hypothetical protein